MSGWNHAFLVKIHPIFHGWLQEDDEGDLQDPFADGNNDNNEVEQEDDHDDMDDNLPPIPTLHKLKSVSEEQRDINNAAEEEMMINDNKIPADDDEDPDSLRVVHKDRQRNNDD